MKVIVKKKDEPKPDVEQDDTLPPEEERDDDASTTGPDEDANVEENDDAEEPNDDADGPISQREHALAVEKAKLEGKLDAMESGRRGPSVDQQQQAYVTQVYADLSLSDDEFQTKYKGYNKVQAIQAINHDLNTQNESKVSKLEAKNWLSRKHPDSLEFEDRIDDALADANPAVLRDPKRLKAFMERQYLALAAEAERIPDPTKAKPKKKEADVSRRTVTNDFTPPTPRSGKERREDEDGVDLIKEEDRALAGKFGLKTEAQRKKYMSEFIPMDLGGGWKYENRKDGFVKTEKAARR